MAEIIYLPRGSNSARGHGVFVVYVWEDDQEQDVDVYLSNECHVLKMDADKTIRLYKESAGIHTVYVIGGYESEDKFGDIRDALYKRYNKDDEG